MSSAIEGTSRIRYTAEELDAMMVPGEYVHTFQQGGGMVLVGSDMNREEILAYVRADTGSCEAAGSTAESLGHGAVVFHQDIRPTFVQTRKLA